MAIKDKLFFVIGLALLGIGLIVLRDRIGSSAQIKVLNTPQATSDNIASDIKIIVEIAGAVIKPGVYSLNKGSRIDDALISSGGLSASADRNWVEKNINRAGVLVDGQKIYIPEISQQQVTKTQSKEEVKSASIGLVNINAASLTELDTLPGIGPVYGQNIIDNRPYSDVGELVSRNILKPSVYEKIKDKISLY